jgi:hypothetical protein
VLEKRQTVVVNVDDRGADPAEVRLLRSYGDRSVLMVPLVVGDETIGLLEATDWERPRRYSPQELRLVRALAGHAAVAMRNAELYQRAREGGEPDNALQLRLAQVAERLAELGDLRVRPEWPAAIARLACAAFSARSCLVTLDGEVAGAAVARTPGEPDEGGREGDEARLLAGLCTGLGGRTEIALTLFRPAVRGEKELLDLLATLVAGLG